MNIIQKKNITIDNFKTVIIENFEIVCWDDIEDQLGKIEYKNFNKWLSGQTCCEGGAFAEDLERYLNQRGQGIITPSIGD